MKLEIKTLLLILLSNLLIISATGWIILHFQESEVKSQVNFLENRIRSYVKTGAGQSDEAVLKQDIENIINPVRRDITKYIRDIILLLLLSILVSATIAYSYMRHIIGYLRQMVSIFDFVKLGNYRNRLKISRSDEVGDLSKAIDGMMDAIQLQMNDLLEKQKEQGALNKQLSTEIITRRKSEEDLRENRYRYKKMVDTVQAGILLINQKTMTIEDVNQSAADIIGLPKDQLTGKSCIQYCCAPDGSCPLLDEDTYFDSHPCILKRNETERVHVLKRVSPLIFNDEKYFLESMLDITPLIETEEKNRELQTTLMQSQKMEAIGLLAGGVAHDFNNILTVMTGNAQLMKMEMEAQDPQYDTLTEIEDAGTRAQALTRQLLAFSRKQVLQLKILNINETISNMIKMLKRLIGAHIVLRTDFKENLPLIKADPGQLEQVLLNLVVNARDAMPEGGEILISTDRLALNSPDSRFHEAPAGDYIQIKVKDSGIGIEAGKLDKVFEPFYTTKPKGKGTGLGLSTVFGIIRQSHGYIHLQSAPGEGSCFTILLPATQGSESDVQDDLNRTLDLMGSEHILVVEDDSFVRDFIEKSLSRFGYSCSHASNGREALDMIRKKEGTYDLILTDVIMPEMNGYLLAENIMATEPRTKILYMSGYSDDSIIPLEELSKLENFIPKPFNSTDLVRKVRMVLG